MLVFDLDDTLYLERDFAFSGYRHLEGWVAETTGVTGFGAACRALFETGDRRRIFNAACAELGLAGSPDHVATLVSEYRNHTPDITLAPDAAHYLRRASRPMGLITDGPEQMQRNKIAALGLEHHIAHIRPTGAWPEGFGKPHPRAYQEMEAAAAGHTRMIYIADNPAKDFVTPNARRWLTIQILRPGAVHDPTPPDEAHAPHARITSLDLLDEVLETLQN
ncbi:MAG: HAD family hydrolase [Ruegeria sp.]|uniref:HAD family hydrolase n=1 Tax=Ruegeria sp. TaxID=1879320 RepID=UPI00349ECB77